MFNTKGKSKTHMFPGGDVLVAEEVATYAGLHGITVYSVFYAEKDGKEYRARGTENFLTEDKAAAAFDARIASVDPSKPIRQDGGTYGVLTDAFARFLGEHPIRSVPIPTDWAGCEKHVGNVAFSHDAVYGYDGKAVHAALDALDGANKLSTNLADVKIELPGWKFFELRTIITGLVLIVQLQNQQLATRKAA